MSVLFPIVIWVKQIDTSTKKKSNTHNVSLDVTTTVYMLSYPHLYINDHGQDLSAYPHY